MSYKTVDLLSKIYDRNPDSKNFVIKLSIKEYTDIFNELDPAPLRWRDLDQRVINYLDDCSSDIPMKYKVDLEIVCPKEIMNEGRENRVTYGLQTFFNYMLLYYRKERKSLYRKALVYLLTSLALIALSFYVNSKVRSNIVYETLTEGLSIGGWVFLWEAIVLAVFKNRKIKHRSQRYKRLATAPITFFYQTY